MHAEFQQRGDNQLYLKKMTQFYGKDNRLLKIEIKRTVYVKMSTLKDKEGREKRYKEEVIPLYERTTPK